MLLVLLGFNPLLAMPLVPSEAEASRDEAAGRAEAGREGAGVVLSRDVAEGEASDLEKEHGWTRLPVPALPGRLPATAIAL